MIKLVKKESLKLAKILPLWGHLIKLERTMNDLYQKTYMDYNKEERMDSNNIKGIIAAVALFAMYAFVSTMDYQDCLRGATSC